MNFFIHQRLRHHWLVLLVVAEATKANDVDKHILVKDRAIVERDFGDQQAGLRVVRIDVKAGDIVETGQTLAIVEAMKMENVLKAEKRARVKIVRVDAGTVLAVDAVILEFEAI